MAALAACGQCSRLLVCEPGGGFLTPRRRCRVNRSTTAVTVTAFFAVALCVAQAQDREADHQALRGLMARTARAIESRDMKALMGCFAKDFVFTSIDQTVMTNETQLLAFNERIFTGKDAPLAKMKMEPEADVLTRFVSGNVGYCFGRSKETYTLKDGHVFVMINRWTATVLKENGEWKIAAVHTGVNFMDNPILTARSMSFWRKLGVALHICKAPWQKAE